MSGLVDKEGPSASAGRPATVQEQQQIQMGNVVRAYQASDEAARGKASAAYNDQIVQRAHSSKSSIALVPYSDTSSHSSGNPTSRALGLSRLRHESNADPTEAIELPDNDDAAGSLAAPGTSKSSAAMKKQVSGALIRELADTSKSSMSEAARVLHSLAAEDSMKKFLNLYKAATKHHSVSDVTLHGLLRIFQATSQDVDICRSFVDLSQEFCTAKREGRLAQPDPHQSVDLEQFDYLSKAFPTLNEGDVLDALMFIPDSDSDVTQLLSFAQSQKLQVGAAKLLLDLAGSDAEVANNIASLTAKQEVKKRKRDRPEAALVQDVHDLTDDDSSMGSAKTSGDASHPPTTMFCGFLKLRCWCCIQYLIDTSNDIPPACVHVLLQLLVQVRKHKFQSRILCKHTNCSVISVC